MLSLNNFKDSTRIKLLSILTALEKQNLTPEQIKFALSQILLETGEFSSKSNVAKLNNNYTGIKFINKPYQIAVKGSPVPPSERVKPDNTPYNFYAKFDNIGDWAKDYIRILNLRGKPIQSDTLEQFHNKLTKNKYYDTSNQNKIDNYLKNLRFYYNKLI